MTLQSSMSERQIAVLIDFENVGLKSMQWLFDQVSDIGRIIVKRAYADWSVQSDKRDQLLELGIEPVHLFRSGAGGKNSSDIRLAIDAIDLLHQSPVDTFVIVSSDSDFVPLVSKLRAAGKMVIGAGHEAIVSRTLVRSCDRYFYLEQSEGTQSSVTAPKDKPAKKQVEQLLMRAVKASIDEQGKVIGSKLASTLQRLDPSFDYRASGYSTFTKFVESFPWVQVSRPKGSGDIVFELKDSPNQTNGKAGESINWQGEIDATWAKKATASGNSIPGPTAALDAARVLGYPKLSSSPYKTLQKLLEASNILNSRWIRRKNTIVRR